GAGPLRVREQPRGGDRKDAVRPLLHQAPLARVRRPHPLRHREDRRLRARGALAMRELLRRIEHHTARIAVIGQGYVGLPLAVEFARSGFQVTGIDADARRVEALGRGDSYIPDVPEAHLREVLEAGRYVATTDTAVLGDHDPIVICVPTPLRKSKDPD